jgi:hypothetical protein
MEIREGEALGRFAREHHVHYEVEPELAGGGDEREVTGFDVRLFATHGEAKLEAPACPRCVELADGLRSFAERLVAGGEAARWTEITPETQTLYQSTEVPGADEVALTLRVHCGADDHRLAGGEDRCLRELRERLEAVGVPQR